MVNSRNNQYFINLLVFIGLLGLFSCASGEPPKSSTPTITPTSPSSKIEENKLESTTLTIGILSPPKYYQELADHFKRQFGNQVQIVIDGNESISYEEARKRIINKEWDIAFTLSPMLSVAAKNNGYHFAARMFAYNPPYYQAALFVKSDSDIQSINDLKPTTTIALGDFNSASSFYMPAYDLFGKTLRVNMGNRGTKIRELVKSGQVDVGAAAHETVKNDSDFRVIHVSRQIPGSNVYLSSNLSELDRKAIKQALINAPDNVKKQANYGEGEEADYSYFIQISQRAEEVLRCANFQSNPVNFFCSDSLVIQQSANTPSITGRINGWTRKNNEVESFSLSGKDNKVYRIIIPRKILNQIPDASNPIALQNKEVKIINVSPQKAQAGVLELRITQPNQLTVLDDVPNSSIPSNYQVKQVNDGNIITATNVSGIQSNYQVKQIDDGDTITVTDVSGQNIKVRFACIDAAETPKSKADNNTNNPADKNQFLWGNKAKERLKSLINQNGNQVNLNIVDTDRYGRKIAEVRLPDGTFVQQTLVKEGLAMVYRQYIKNCASASIVEQAEAEAKQQRLNIWGDSQFTAPWDYRRMKKSRSRNS
ncbi:MAG TPA: PhnD/SsuA/transferrin family substrate-binding protein [Nostocaceae cyanobacterium]|nr:PhnD/SsuA/transferrin family substrate-binding protein [Nostocaceae cyanobacterium]